MTQPGDSLAAMEKLTRPRLTAAVVFLACLAACTPSTPSPAPSATEPQPAGSTPTAESATYALPRAADVCAAARRSGLDVVGTKADGDNRFTSNCKVSVPSSGKRRRDLPYTLRVKLQLLRDAAQAKDSYDSSKNTDWYRNHSPFSGTATKRAEVRQVGKAQSGRQYDEAYYAYYPDHQVAGSRNSESVLTLRKGNVLLTLDLLAGDLTGTTVASIKPVAAGVGRKIFDEVADEVVALIRPTSG